MAFALAVAASCLLVAAQTAGGPSKTEPASPGAPRGAMASAGLSAASRLQNAVASLRAAIANLDVSSLRLAKTDRDAVEAAESGDEAEE